MIFYETVVNLSSQSSEGNIGQAMTKAKELTDLILQPELLGTTSSGTEGLVSVPSPDSVTSCKVPMASYRSLFIQMAD